MQVTLLKSKLLRAEVTDRALHYEGSLAIDSALMKQIGLIPNEKILVANIANGERLETYAIEAPKGSHTISLNGQRRTRGKSVTYSSSCLSHNSKRQRRDLGNLKCSCSVKVTRLSPARRICWWLKMSLLMLHCSGVSSWAALRHLAISLLACR